MIDHKINYVAVVFINSQLIEPTSENISKLINIFVDKGLLPNIQTNKILKLHTHDMEWIVTFLPDKIVIAKNITTLHGENLGDLPVFCNEAVDIINKILNAYPRSPNRIALGTRYILNEMSENQFTSIYKNLFNTSDFYKVHIPYEWNLRFVSELKKPFLKTEEKFNFITDVARTKGNLELPYQPMSLDRIGISIDINSHQDNPSERFNSESITYFYNNVTEWHSDLLTETLNFIEPWTKK